MDRNLRLCTTLYRYRIWLGTMCEHVCAFIAVLFFCSHFSFIDSKLLLSIHPCHLFSSLCFVLCFHRLIAITKLAMCLFGWIWLGKRLFVITFIFRSQYFNFGVTIFCAVCVCVCVRCMCYQVQVQKWQWKRYTFDSKTDDYVNSDGNFSFTPHFCFCTYSFAHSLNGWVF